jgi:hypothetical protein
MLTAFARLKALQGELTVMVADAEYYPLVPDNVVGGAKTALKSATFIMDKLSPFGGEDWQKVNAGAWSEQKWADLANEVGSELTLALNQLSQFYLGGGLASRGWEEIVVQTASDVKDLGTKAGAALEDPPGAFKWATVALIALAVIVVGVKFR